jgi:hypothetical protein
MAPHCLTKMNSQLPRNVVLSGGLYFSFQNPTEGAQAAAATATPLAEFPNPPSDRFCAALRLAQTAPDPSPSPAVLSVVVVHSPRSAHPPPGDSPHQPGLHPLAPGILSLDPSPFSGALIGGAVLRGQLRLRSSSRKH